MSYIRYPGKLGKIIQNIGIAYSDANSEHKDLNELVMEFAIREWVEKSLCSHERNTDRYLLEDYLKLNVPLDWPGIFFVELQPEAYYYVGGNPNSNSWLKKGLIEYDSFPGISDFLTGCRKEGIITIHAPTTNGIKNERGNDKRDLSSLNHGHWQWSLDETIAAMELANKIGAKYFVVHGSNYEWGQEIDKKKRIEMFFQSFEKLCEAYFGHPRYNFTFLIENIEKPKFPADSGEFKYIFNECKRIYDNTGRNLKFKNPLIENNDCKIKMLLDIPHFVNNYLIGNGFSPEKLHDAIDEVENFIDENKEEIGYFHIAGCRLRDGNSWLSTHDPIYKVQRIYDLEEVNLERIFSIPIIRELNRPILLEVFNVPLGVVRNSLWEVRNYFLAE